MYKTAKTLFIHCLTPMHAGSGSDLGIVDLPIQRERHTGFPKIEASSLKGALREAFEEKLGEKDKNISAIFGPEDATGDNTYAGCLGFSDARLLLFPVKSMRGIFAWITCPRVLRQFETDVKLTTGNDKFEIKEIPSNLLEGKCQSESQSLKIEKTDKIILEEYTFQAENKCPKIENVSFGKWIFEKIGLQEEPQIVVLNDNDFKDFVNLSTEVITRTKIDNNTGTVAPGALFTEEYLPSESIMYSLVLASGEFGKREKSEKMDDKKVMDFFETQLPEIVQIGGNATLGKGIVKTKVIGGVTNGK